MLKSSFFSKVSSYAGIIAAASAIVAEIFENTFKILFKTSIALYFIALVALLVLVLSTGIQFIRLSKTMRPIIENKKSG
jgi:hypothetical protein